MILIKFSFDRENYFRIFTFSSHTKYVKRESIIIGWIEKKILLLMNDEIWKKFSDQN